MTAWRGRDVVVLGLAKSGLAAAKFLHTQGANVVANDAKQRSACPEAEELEQLGISVICGQHPPDLIHDQVALVVKNPGVPYHIAPVEQALARGIPVITEVELAGQLSVANLVGITGSNGKTTTTTLVGEMLAAGRLPVHVAGNIGTALLEVAPKMAKSDWLVAELSSFQLKGTRTFHPHVAALLNLYPAHLDYHQTVDDYRQAKERLFQQQTVNDFAVLNYDSPVCREIGEQLNAQVIWFSRLHEVTQGVFVRDGQIVAKLPQQEEQIVLAVSQIALPGEFNLENALAATAIALSCGCSVAAIADVLPTFRGVAHRLEYVDEIAGVSYYNDSKATNPQAAMKALQSFAEPVIWIAGGLDRGIDFRELVPMMQQQVQALLAYGESAEILLQRAADAGVPQAIQVESIEQAVSKAKQIATVGDTVLLSPACASWDQHTSFEQRGSIFKQAVHKL